MSNNEKPTDPQDPSSEPTPPANNDGAVVPVRKVPQNPAGGSYLSADLVRAKLDAARYSHQHIDTILWLLEYGRSMRVSQAELAETIDLDSTIISRLFSATYPGDVQKQIDKIDHHRRLLAQEVTGEQRPICQTWVLREIDKFCAMVRLARVLGILTGKSHTGKTVALITHKTQNNHGLTVYTRMPPGGAPSLFMASMARSCGISPKNSFAALRDRFIQFLRPGMLLIIDEMHQTLIGRKTQIQTLELIRDMHDLTGCAIVMCGTPIFADSFKDERVSLFFEQIDNRGPLKRRLPDEAPWNDVLMVLAAYGLPPAPRKKLDEKHHKSPLTIVKEMVAGRGLGKLTKFLLLARAAANKHQEVFSWYHVVRTDAMLTGWERGDGPADEKGGR